MFNCIAVTNRKLCSGDFFTQLERLAQAGLPIILREKDLPLAEYTQMAAQAVEICRKYHSECILHFYPEAARTLGTAKLHLPLGKLEENLALAQEFTVGVSTHSVEQAQKAQALGAAYITAGHVFVTDCKKGLAPRGLDFLQAVCKSVSIPVYAIGGISPENAQQAIKAGAAGVCMMSQMMQAEQPADLLQSLKM